MEQKELLNLLVELGCALLQNGAETYRVEESVMLFAAACREDTPSVFAVPTCVMVSLTDGEGRTVTKSRRLHNRTVDLDRLDRLNNFCRRACSQPMTAQQAWQELEEIQASRTYSLPLKVLGFMLISFSFTLFFGGTLRDALFSLAMGAAAEFVVYAMERWGANGVFVNLVASGLAALLAAFAVELGPADNVDKMVIGTFMALVPGVALTNAMRDIMAGDYLAGQTRLTEALLTAAALALGAGAALSLARML